MAGGTVFKVDKTAPTDQPVLRNFRERGEDVNLDRGIGLRVGGHRQEAVEVGCLPLHIDAGLFGDSV
jgi:hypothetical protein